MNNATAINPKYYTITTPSSEIKMMRIFGASEREVYKLYGYWLKRDAMIKRLKER